MSNRSVLLLGAAMAGAVLADVLVIESGATILAMKKLADLVEYLSFWR